MVLKVLLVLGLLGHIGCGIGDCLLSYGPKGRLDFTSIKDPQKMAAAFEGMPPRYSLLSALLGTYSIMLFGFGCFGLCGWISAFSRSGAAIMQVSTVVFLIPIVVHHVICGVVEWFYIRLDRSDEARTIVLEFQKKTISTMFVGYLGWLVFVVTLFYFVVTGRTTLPAWACIWNTLPMMVILMPTKLPAKGNIAGAVMFLGLLIMI